MYAIVKAVRMPRITGLIPQTIVWMMLRKGTV